MHQQNSQEDPPASNQKAASERQAKSARSQCEADPAQGCYLQGFVTI